MQYEIKRENRFKQLQRKIRSLFEDGVLMIALSLAKIVHSEKLNNWITNYTQKKIQKMQAEIIRMKWDKITLDKAAASIRKKQSNN